MKYWNRLYEGAKQLKAIHKKTQCYKKYKINKIKANILWNADYDFLNKALKCEEHLKLIAWKIFLESNTNFDSFVKSLNYYQKTKMKFYCELRDLSIFHNFIILFKTNIGILRINKQGALTK